MNDPKTLGFVDPQTPEIVTRSTHEFNAVLERVKAVNGHVLSVERLPRCNAGWRVLIRWPAQHARHAHA